MTSIKTAISIEESLYEEVTALANAMQIPRSKLFAIAMEEFFFIFTLIPNPLFPYKYFSNNKASFSLVAAGAFSKFVKIAYFKAECASLAGGFALNRFTVS